ncbi:MAG: hypothetical protein UT53_C0028G0013 [Candidatus Yanofskybacteria bacterium GW2011_GWD2_39_48]|uniref:Uncharacterized protein n=1 Tax=Candidatus Yanofskybacteria bacterium GW2011_GWD2_39_48 TaxID=1619031 RepID=A0A0G0P4H1_9BACT|nr:MAG: hypothetical protein UT53_C0028G0013 [Candidatus Yanofskybacteria bacterium GW2011_GWD2_39_48]
MTLGDRAISPEITRILRKISDLNAAEILAIAGSDAVKVRLERVYDRLFTGKFGKNIKDLPIGIKHLIEVIAYTSHSILGNKFGHPKSPLGIFLREIVEDMPAELGRRMLNGDLGPSHGIPAIEADFLVNSSLFELTPDEIKEVTRWLATLTEDQKNQFREILKKASVDSLQRESRTLLLDTLGPNAGPEKRKYFEEMLLGIKHEIDAFNKELDGVLARKRQRRQQRREKKGRG